MGRRSAVTGLSPEPKGPEGEITHVRDLAFYNAGCHETRGVRRAVVPFRRALRRVLRPIFLRQVELLQEIWHRLDHLDHEVHALHHELHVLSQRQDDLAEQLKTTLAFGWDYVALVRRLAIMEDQIATLTGASATTLDDTEAQTSILFPGFKRDPEEPRAKVC
jgi:hypothetical protein